MSTPIKRLAKLQSLGHSRPFAAATDQEFAQLRQSTGMVFEAEVEPIDYVGRR